MGRCMLVWLLAAAACSLVQYGALGEAEAAVDEPSPTRSLLQATTTTVCPAIQSCRRCVVSPTTGVNTCSVCKSGYKATKDNLNCVCPPGRYQLCTGSGCSCVTCGMGFYCPGGDMQSGNNAAATANGVRKSCVRGGVDAMDTSESIANSGLTTTTTLATSSNQCVVVAGCRLANGVEVNQHAERCTGATFSAGSTRQRQCTKCMTGLVRDDTLTAGALQTSSRQVCRVPAGSYLTGSTVQRCLVGTYRTGQADPTDVHSTACLPCPTGWTTVTAGTQQAAECSVGRPGYQLASGATASTPNLCPEGTYYPGGSVAAGTKDTCIKCPGASVTAKPGATAETECMVPPGYYIKGTDLAKCPESVTVNGISSGYYRPGWVSYLDATVNEPNDAEASGTRACKSCGAGILSEWVENDVNPLAASSSRVAASELSCYITPGMGISLDMDNKGYYRGYYCSANTFSTATNEVDTQDEPTPSGETRIYGLRTALCQPCKAGLRSNARSTSFDQCVVPPGWGLNVDATASQCPDGFWSAGGDASSTCTKCPVGRTTVPDSTSPGTEQNAQTSCYVQPGLGLHFNSVPNGADPWLIPQGVSVPPKGFLTASVASVLECPVGYYGQGGSPDAINSLCQKCPAGATTSASGSNSPDDCSGCLAGYGNVGTSSLTCLACAYGQYQEHNGAAAACSHCPSTTFNFPGDTPYTSIGTSLTIGSSSSQHCIARATQLDYDTGFGFGLEAATGWVAAAASVNTMAKCIDACPIDKCCFAELRYAADSTTTGTCRTLSYQVVEPFTAPATGFQLFYKIAPSPATATAVRTAGALGQVQAMAIASGMYTQCTVMGYGSESEFLSLGGNMTDGGWQANTRAECRTRCDDSAACWGFFYHNGNCLLRTGVKDSRVRSIFVAAAAPECTGNSYAIIGMSYCRQCTGGVVNEARNDCTFPPQPASSLVAVSISATQVTISWTTPSPATDNAVVSYELRCMSSSFTSCRDTAAGTPATNLAPSPTQQATVSGLNANVQYKCYVIAYNLAAPASTAPNVAHSGVCSLPLQIQTATS